MKHLTELTRRLMRVGIVFVLLFAVVLYCSDAVLTAVVLPVKKHFSHLIFSKFLGPIMLQFKLALWVVLLLSAPYLLLEMWWYIKPALYQQERAHVFSFLIPSVALFYCGVFFAWEIILPQLSMLSHFWVPMGIEAFIDIESVLESILGISLIMGIAFQLPVMMRLIAQMGSIPEEFFVAKRKEAILIALVVGMCLTPPDVVAQVIMALPLYALYEIGIVLIRYTRSFPVQNNQHVALSDGLLEQKIQSSSDSDDSQSAGNQKQ